MAFSLRKEKRLIRKIVKSTSLISFSFLILIGCQSLKLKTRGDLIPSQPAVTIIQQPVLPSKEHTEPAAQNNITESLNVPTKASQAPPPPPLIVPNAPKIGLILGAGGAKTFAHIGFLQELVKFKVPIHAIGGIEFATPIAALFAHRAQPNDAEWQMFKLKDEDIIRNSIINPFNKNQDVTLLKDFAASAFNKDKIEDYRIPFACPTFNLKRSQVYLMNQGTMEQALYYCVAYPPFYQPYLGNVSAIRDISSLATYLRQKGANYIVLVNVLKPSTSGKILAEGSSVIENILWSEITNVYNSKVIFGVDSIINLDVNEYGILDFDKRRDIMNKGAESSALQLKYMTRKWGF